MTSIAGTGLGLRQPHIREILDHRPPVPWFEVLTDNYLGIGGEPLEQLLEIRSHYPVVLHGVGMNLGSTDPLDESYLDKVCELRDLLQPEWISDHLCWTAVGGRCHHDLLPLPFTEEVVAHLSERISRVQDRLGERILVENASAYIRFRNPEFEEWEFVREVAERADCDVLLDINNIYVNSFNFGFDPSTYIEAVPASRVRQLHLAGYADQGSYLVDTHGADITAAVWRFYQASLKHLGAIPVSIERDNDIPAFDVLYAELEQAQRLIEDETGGAD